MNIIKTIISKEWYRFFFSSAVILFVLLAVANLISGLLRGNVSAREVLMNFVLEIPFFINKIIPISCLAASLFSINKLKNRNELTAIFASGFSRKNFVLTLLSASLLVSLFQFFIASFVVPFAKKNRSFLLEDTTKFRNQQSLGLRASTAESGKIWYRSKNYFFSFVSFEHKSNSLHDVSLFYFDDSYKITHRISAPIATYLNKSIWIFKNGFLINELSNLEFPYLKFFEELPIQIDEAPSDFKQIEADITTLNIIQLYNYIKKLKTSGININEYLVLLFDKASTAIICIIFTLLASFSIFNPNRRNSSFGKDAVLIFVFTILYWFIYSYLIELGTSSKIHALVACFTIPVAFIFLVIAKFIQNRKLQ